MTTTKSTRGETITNLIMEWKPYYLDMMLVPLGFMITIGYHVWLWHKTRSEPFSTTIGINAHARRFWVPTMLKVIML